MTTKRSTILAAVKTTLEGVSGMTEVMVNRTTPIDIETIGFPCAFVYSGPETRLTDDRSVMAYENWEWQVQVEVWARDQDMEELLGLIHAAMFTNRFLNGNAVTCYRTSVDMLVVDPDKSLGVMLLTFTVVYRHPQGVM